MTTPTTLSASTVVEFPWQSDRRHDSRTPALFSLLYSGMANGQMAIGNGLVINLSPGGIGVRGNRSVAPGMTIALFLDFPGMKEPLCIAQSLVAWVVGNRFGVDLGVLKLEEKHDPRLFLWHHIIHSDNDHGI